MARVGVTFDTAAFQRALDAEAARLQRTARRAVNELAFRARDAIRGEMDRVFDRPTPWVKNGVMVVPARGEENSAGVEWKPGSIGSIPAEKILRAQIEGGGRRLKRFERALQAVGVLPPGMIAVWAKTAPLDRFGNLTGGRITKILSYFRAFPEVGFQANRRADGRSRGKLKDQQFFVVRGFRNSTRLPPGIYERRRRGNPRMVIAFVKPPSYRPRFNPAAVAARVVREQSAEVWQLALERRLPFRGGGS